MSITIKITTMVINDNYNYYNNNKMYNNSNYNNSNSSSSSSSSGSSNNNNYNNDDENINHKAIAIIACIEEINGQSQQILILIN
jgi:hypothetical protein